MVYQSAVNKTNHKGEDQLYYLGIKVIIQNALKEVLILKSVKGYWEYPGGRIQEGEEVKDALLREVKEETGLIHLENIKPDATLVTSIKIPSPYDSAQKCGLILFYHTCSLKTVTPCYLSQEHSEYAWVNPAQAKSLTALPDTIAPHIFKN
jgi:8-oxo-dGTP pyrophosphatase MutT (NUDIX family)